MDYQAGMVITSYSLSLPLEVDLETYNVAKWRNDRLQWMTKILAFM
jgi:hypothetical protein